MEQVKDSFSKSEKFLWSALDTTNDAVLLTDDFGFLYFMSSNTADLFGLDIKECLAIENISDLIGERLFEPAELKIAGAIKNIEFQFNGCHNEKRTLQINVRSVDLWEGTIMYCCRDITEAKKAAQVLHDFERLKAEFLVMAGHELRTPLTVVQGYADLLLRQQDLAAETRERCLGVIFEKAQELAQITNDLLSLSDDLESRRLNLPKSMVYANHLVERVTSNLYHKIPAHQLEERLPESHVCLWVNQARIERVLEILLDHVFKNSPLKAKIILCGQQRGREFAFLIADETIEISQGQQHLVFDRFFRTDVLNQAFAAPGFGMSIARMMVEEHGGSFLHESPPGKGPRFFFTVPLVEETKSHE